MSGTETICRANPARRGARPSATEPRADDPAQEFEGEDVSLPQFVYDELGDEPWKLGGDGATRFGRFLATCLTIGIITFALTAPLFFGETAVGVVAEIIIALGLFSGGGFWASLLLALICSIPSYVVYHTHLGNVAPVKAGVFFVTLTAVSLIVLAVQAAVASGTKSKLRGYYRDSAEEERERDFQAEYNVIRRQLRWHRNELTPQEAKAYKERLRELEIRRMWIRQAVARRQARESSPRETSREGRARGSKSGIGFGKIMGLAAAAAVVAAIYDERRTDKS